MKNIRKSFLEKRVSEEFNKNKWETKTLEEIIKQDIFAGDSKITHNYKDKGDFPAITSKDVLTSEMVINKCKVFVNKLLTKEKVLIEKGDVLIINNEFSSEKLGKSCAYLGDQECIAGNNIFVIKHSQNPKYLVHLLSSKYIKKQIKNLWKGGNSCWLLRKDIKKLKILLPDIETQNKIVEFLDKFINLKQEMEVEMEVEMEKRSKQYEYYKELISNIGI